MPGCDGTATPGYLPAGTITMMRMRDQGLDYMPLGYLSIKPDGLEPLRRGCSGRSTPSSIHTRIRYRLPSSYRIATFQKQKTKKKYHGKYRYPHPHPHATIKSAAPNNARTPSSDPTTSTSTDRTLVQNIHQSPSIYPSILHTLSISALTTDTIHFHTLSLSLKSLS